VLRWGIGAAIVLVAGFIGGITANAINGSNNSSSTATTTQGASATASACNVTTVAHNVLPSVVTILARNNTAAGNGSGEVIKADGYILTNNHVIALAANGGSINVLFSNGETVPATLTGRDPLTDVAVIKVDKPDLNVIGTATSANLDVGQPVVVLGAPLGLSSTVTSGIVSALGRTITVPGESDTESALLIDAVQTDASINPGNSGGAMVNCSGQFIGMPTAGASVPSASGEGSSGSVGLGFAVPSDLALREADEIIATGRVRHSYIGIISEPVSPNEQPVNGVAEGLLITAIDPNGPAQAAGLRMGDIITTIDGAPAVSNGQIVELMIRKRPGDTVSIGYVRPGNSATVTVSVTLVPEP
jgi:putative serine protease PepD